jgi:hypothetical protein
MPAHFDFQPLTRSSVVSGSVVWRGRIDFEHVKTAALNSAEEIVRGLLPDGRREGSEWVARNPLRADRRPGSFKVNLITGRWADFATGDRGGDLISLSAFVAGVDQRSAAVRLADALGIDPFCGAAMRPRAAFESNPSGLSERFRPGGGVIAHRTKGRAGVRVRDHGRPTCGGDERW